MKFNLTYDKFNGFDIGISIETPEEAAELWHRLNVTPEEFREYAQYNKDSEHGFGLCENGLEFDVLSELYGAVDEYLERSGFWEERNGYIRSA